VAKSFLTPEQMKVFMSKPFVRERNDKPRWCFKQEDDRARARYKKRKGIDADWLPHKEKAVGKHDYLFHTQVTMAQILRILNGDHKARVRDLPPRRGYTYVESGHQIV